MKIGIDISLCCCPCPRIACNDGVAVPAAFALWAGDANALKATTPGTPSGMSTSSTDSSGSYNGGDVVIWRLYSWRTMLGVRVYSASYFQWTDTAPGANTAFYLVWPAVTPHDGYRVLRQVNGGGFNDYSDIAFGDESLYDNASVWTAGNTVTPTSGFEAAGNGDAVAAWRDSLAALDMLATVGTVNFYTAQVNGFGALRFTPSSTVLSAAVASQAVGSEVLIVKPRSTGQQTFTGTGNQSVKTDGAAPDHFRIAAGANLTSATLSNVAWRVVAVIFNGASSVLSLVEGTTRGTAGSNATTALQCGASGILGDFDIAYRKRWNVALTETQLKSAADAAAATYGVTSITL